MQERWVYNPGMNQQPEIWKPLEGLPEGAQDWGNLQYHILERQWLEARTKMKAGDPADRFVAAWLAESRMATGGCRDC